MKLSEVRCGHSSHDYDFQLERHDCCDRRQCRCECAMLERAEALARRIHDRQKDKAGAPYIGHPLRVAARFDTVDERIVALLHDAIEDGGEQARSIIEYGYPKHIVEAIDAMTRRDGETYGQHIERVCTNKIAMLVKIADLLDNSDLTRIPNPGPRDLARTAKYGRAVQRILEHRKWKGLEVDDIAYQPPEVVGRLLVDDDATVSAEQESDEPRHATPPAEKNTPKSSGG